MGLGLRDNALDELAHLGVGGVVAVLVGAALDLPPAARLGRQRGHEDAALVGVDHVDQQGQRLVGQLVAEALADGLSQGLHARLDGRQIADAVERVVAVELGVHVEPVDDPPEAGAVQLDALLAFLVRVSGQEHLRQLARVGEVVHGLAGVALAVSRGHPQHAGGQQRLVRQRPASFAVLPSLGPQLRVAVVADQADVPRRLVAAVAADAVAVQHGLDGPGEAEAARVILGDRRGDLADLRVHGRTAGRGGVSRLVAAHARGLFARLEVHQAPHGHEGHPVGVQELELEGPAGRGLEGHRPVRLDRHGAQDLLDDLVVGGAAYRGGGGRLGQDLVDPHLLDAAAGDGLLGLVDVFDDEHAGLLALAPGDGRNQRRRAGARPQRDRVEARDVPRGVDQFAPAQRVDEIDGVLLAVLVGAEEQVLVDGPGRGRPPPAGTVLGERLGRADNPVRHARLREAQLGRDPLQRAAVILPRVRVDHDDRAQRLPVMGGRGGHRLRAAGDGLRFADQARGGRVVAVVVGGLRAVGMDQPQALELHVVAIDVVPAGVHDRAVVQDGRAPLVGLVEGQGADVRAVRFAAIQRVAGHVPPAVAAPVLLAAGGDERDPPVRQIARVHVLDEHGLAPVAAFHRVGARAGDLAELARLEVQLVDEVALEVPVSPALQRVVDSREQHPLAVVRQVRVEHARLGQHVAQQGRLAGRRLPVVQDDQALALLAVAAEILVAHVLRQEARPLVDQQPVEAELWVRQDDPPAQLAGGLVQFLARAAPLAQLGVAPVQLVQFGCQLGPGRGPLHELQRPAPQLQAGLDGLDVEQVPHGQQVRDALAGACPLLSRLAGLALALARVPPRQLGQVLPVVLPDGFFQVDLAQHVGAGEALHRSPPDGLAGLLRLLLPLLLRAMVHVQHAGLAVLARVGPDGGQQKLRALVQPQAHLALAGLEPAGERAVAQLERALLPAVVMLPVLARSVDVPFGLVVGDRIHLPVAVHHPQVAQDHVRLALDPQVHVPQPGHAELQFRRRGRLGDLHPHRPKALQHRVAEAEFLHLLVVLSLHARQRLARGQQRFHPRGLEDEELVLAGERLGSLELGRRRNANQQARQRQRDNTFLHGHDLGQVRGNRPHRKNEGWNGLLGTACRPRAGRCRCCAPGSRCGRIDNEQPVAIVAFRPAGRASRTGRRSRADGGARPGEVGQHVPVAGLPPRRGTDADRSAPGGRGLQARDRRRRQAQGGGLEHDAVQGPGHPGQPPAHVHLEAPPRRDARPLLVRAQREPDSRACLPQAGSRT
ncbi:MAG: hypothetical protein BWX88_01656 [Planctomycetes bacterium ADurb.Bin126]|nr:MAG: hypothetical protein BWX88_01656 [Planctomycetes bacterium ADurb.Bin126]